MDKILNIICVHEDKNYITRIKNLIKSNDSFTICCFDNSEEACEYIKDNQPDYVVILGNRHYDGKMPNDGLTYHE